MGEIRARSREEKAERLAAILSAARLMLREKSYEKISLIELAKQAGIAKSTLYVYCKTREDLFLWLFEETYKKFINRLQKRLRSRTVSIQRYANIYYEELIRDELLLPLIEQLHLVIEKNSTPEVVCAFKLRMHETFDGLAQVAASKLSCSPEIFSEFFLLCHMQTTSLFQAANMPEETKRMLADSAASRFVIDFKSALQRAVLVLAKGLDIG